MCTQKKFDDYAIFQECKYFNKNVIYARDKNMNDGGNVYWNAH